MQIFLAVFCLKTKKRKTEAWKIKVSATLLVRTVFQLTHWFSSLREGRAEHFPFPFGRGYAGRCLPVPRPRQSRNRLAGRARASCFMEKWENPTETCRFKAQLLLFPVLPQTADQALFGGFTQKTSSNNFPPRLLVIAFACWLYKKWTALPITLTPCCSPVPCRWWHALFPTFHSWELRVPALQKE